MRWFRPHLKRTLLIGCFTGSFMLYFALSILLSSFLLFQIQPLVSKYILPWFGGTTSVWSASLLFFQVLLTGGYAYSYLLIGRLSPRRQGPVHLTLLGVSLALLGLNLFAWASPILPGESWRNLNPDQPLGEVLKILFVAVGFPYFLLSTNSSLMPAWFFRDHPGRSPYWLYAISNIGSLIGLVTYPILFEPFLSLRNQSVVWTAGYGIFVVVVAYGSWRNRKQLQFVQIENHQVTPDPKGLTESLGPKSGEDIVMEPRSTLKTNLYWVGLAALASVMLLSTTSRITQEVAVIPFLWILPLTVYLVSFILTFSSKSFYNRWVFLTCLWVATVAYLWFVMASVISIVVQIGIYLFLLFAATMNCHGELYRLRPDASHLARFFLWVSAGGALGGIVVNLIVPLIFNGYWEFQIGLGAIWVLMLVYMLNLPYQLNFYLRRGLTAGAAIMTCLVLVSVYIQTNAYSQNSLATYRNFYGILNVKEKMPDDPENHHIVLTHGITNHGYQFTSPEKRHLPTAYYVEGSGVGTGFKNNPTRPAPLKVGIIGLGVGVLAVYGQEGDEFRFYEINPAVVEIAQSEYFSFLRDTEANVEIVLGDGRISLEKELTENGPHHFDMLVLDAFNSDSIPTHLLTLEAFELYLHHLKPDGILALHISNQHLNLRPVVWQLAEALGLDGLAFYNTSEDLRVKPSLWILLTNNQEFLSNPEVIALSLERENDLPNFRLWTDDYSDLFQILK